MLYFNILINITLYIFHIHISIIIVNSNDVFCWKNVIVSLWYHY